MVNPRQAAAGGPLHGLACRLRDGANGDVRFAAGLRRIANRPGLDKFNSALDITVAAKRLDRSSRARGFDETQDAKGGEHARTDAEPPTSYIGPRRLRLDLAWKPGDRVPRRGRRGPSLKLRRSRGARQTRRQRARRAWGWFRRPRRDACLEQLSASRNLLWRDELRTCSAHGQSAPLSRSDPIHHASRGRRVCVLRPGFHAAHRGARPPPAACARLGRALRQEPASPDQA